MKALRIASVFFSLLMALVLIMEESAGLRNPETSPMGSMAENDPYTLSPSIPLTEFLVPHSSRAGTIPCPELRQILFKWRIQPVELEQQTLITEYQNPEPIQDIQRCPTVAIVLFPYHEFL